MNARWEAVPLQQVSHDSLAVYSVAFSTDNRVVIAGGEGIGGIYRWYVADGSLLPPLEDCHDSIASIAVAPNGAAVVGGSYTGNVTLWNWDQGSVQFTVSSHTAAVNSVAFSPDGQLLASGSSDNSIRIWHAESGMLSQLLTGHTAAVNSVAFSPDGQLLASGSNDEAVKLWDPRTGQNEATLIHNSYHLGGVIAVTFHPTEHVLASGNFREDEPIVLWDVSSSRMIMTVRGQTDEVMALTFSHDGNFIASGSTGRFDGVEVWRIGLQK